MTKQQTAMQVVIGCLKLHKEVLIENEFHDKDFSDIDFAIQTAESTLEKEKQQITDFGNQMYGYGSQRKAIDAEEYFIQTYNL